MELYNLKKIKYNNWKIGFQRKRGVDILKEIANINVNTVVTSKYDGN